MVLGKPITPYCSKVVAHGRQTNFSCQDRKKDPITGRWTSSIFYMVNVPNLNLPIRSQNPEGYKLIVKGITGTSVGFSVARPQFTVWASDVSILDRDGNVIIESVAESSEEIGKTNKALMKYQKKKIKEKIAQRKAAEEDAHAKYIADVLAFEGGNPAEDDDLLGEYNEEEDDLPF